MMQLPTVVVVTRKTRYRGLLERWATRGQAKFRLKQARLHEAERQQQAAATMTEEELEADFVEYEREDQVYREGLGQLEHDLDFGLPVKILDREFLPTYNFSGVQAVVVVGQDGLVANTAKYVGSIPIVAINPDPARFDGVLLPFRLNQARAVVGRTLDGKFRTRAVSLAEVQLSDTQRMLAFNDFFVGSASHISARYRIEVGGRQEPQSSSGVIVSTGAGSTGWLSSLFNMASGLGRFLGAELPAGPRLKWEDRKLMWVVREPFVSRTSQANLVAGLLEGNHELVLESQMPESGVIFSDGVESDFLQFNSGTIARIGVARQQARLVIPQ